MAHGLQICASGGGLVLSVVFLCPGDTPVRNHNSTTPEYKHQEKRDKEAKTGLDKNQAEVGKDIKNNIGDGSGDNKGGKPKGGIVSKILGGLGVVAGIIEQITNPDPTKDAHEAHMEEAEKNTPPPPQEAPKEPNVIEKLIDSFF